MRTHHRCNTCGHGSQKHIQVVKYQLIISLMNQTRALIVVYPHVLVQTRILQTLQTVCALFVYRCACVVQHAWTRPRDFRTFPRPQRGGAPHPPLGTADQPPATLQLPQRPVAHPRSRTAYAQYPQGVVPAQKRRAEVVCARTRESNPPRADVCQCEV